MAQKDIITSILYKNRNSGYALTAREIFHDMEPSEQDDFSNGPDQVSKVLCQLRNAGIVENGISNIVNGRTVLTWKLKHHASIQHMPNQPQSTQQQHQENTVETIAETDIDAIADEPHAISQTTESNPACAVDENVSQPMETEVEFLAHLQNAVALFVDAYKTLLQERDHALAQSQNVHMLTNKTEKLGLLNLLKSHYGYINSDFETVLNDIINDLEHMETD